MARIESRAQQNYLCCLARFLKFENIDTGHRWHGEARYWLKAWGREMRRGA